MSAAHTEEWDAVGREWRTRRHAESLWRQHADYVNREWVKAQLSSTRGRVLKTDCFDEATGEGLAALLRAHSDLAVGIDVSSEVLSSAAKHPGSLRMAKCDIRDLPFADGTFDLVVSNSTLDHFESAAELERGIREIARVIRPGGDLLLTLDNPRHPVVAVRNLLPASVGKATGLVPYRVGATLGRRAMRKALERAGFAVRREDAILHVPRVVILPAARFLHRNTSPRTQAFFLRALAAVEGIGCWPTRYLSGHFVAAVARRFPPRP